MEAYLTFVHHFWGGVHCSTIFPTPDDDSLSQDIYRLGLPSFTHWDLWCFVISLQTANEQLNFTSSACDVHTLNWHAPKLFFDKRPNWILHENWRKEEERCFHAARLPWRIIKWAGHCVVVKCKSCQSSVATSLSLGEHKSNVLRRGRRN